jgi:type II secretory pathway pseudopilin PulG
MVTKVLEGVETLNKQTNKQTNKQSKPINIKKNKAGISLIVLVITIIVIIILAAAVILTLTNNNPINNANQASFVNDLDSFKSELDMYKASEYAKRIGDFEQTSLEGDEISLTFDGQTPEEAGSQTMYTAIPSLKGVSKYAGQFAIEDGKLVYMGTDEQKIDWASSAGVENRVAGEPKVVAFVTGDDVIEPGTDIIYTVRVTSTVTFTMTSDLISKIKVTDATTGVELATQPGIELGEVTGTDTEKQFSVKVLTGILPYGEYNLQILEGIATNTENIANQPYTDVNGFEITDQTPPETPEISATPTEYTSGNVVVTIDYKNADVKLYSFTGNVGDWQTYTSALTISTNNTTVYAMGKDSSENETGIVTKTIANIDRVAPTVAFGTNGVTDETQVSTTITVSDNKELNISTLQYVWDTQNVMNPSTGWTTFTNAGTVSKTGDGTYYLWVKASDSAGNNVVIISNSFSIGESIEIVSTIQTEHKTFAGATTGFDYNNPVIPAGFVAVNTTAASWNNLGVDYNNGLVIQDANGNQFVWVPVDASVPYAKWCTTHISYTSTSNDTLPTGVTSESTQIDTYKGFYIARFEAGNASSTVVSKKNMAVWNNINYTNAKSTAESMYTSVKLKSGLVTGTMWDTTMKWVQNSGKSVTDSRTWGNHVDSTSPANVSGFGAVQATGYSNNWEAKNIYDLAGNVREWTNEIYGSDRIDRGSHYGGSGVTIPVSYRSARRCYWYQPYFRLSRSALYSVVNCY